MVESIHILLIAMSPIIELRGAIPFAIAVYEFPAGAAFILSVLGNTIPPLFLIPFFGRVSEFLCKKSPHWRYFITNYLEKIRSNHQRKFEVLKTFGLLVLVAVPLPLTGAWTASLAAYVFGVPFRRAIPIILLGLIIAGVIVTLVTIGAIAVFAP